MHLLSNERQIHYLNSYELTDLCFDTIKTLQATPDIEQVKFSINAKQCLSSVNDTNFERAIDDNLQVKLAALLSSITGAPLDVIDTTVFPKKPKKAKKKI